MRPPEDSHGYEFENFVLDRRAHALWRGNQEISLTPKEFQTLLFLVESAGVAVSKETLLRAVWCDTFVSDSSLTRNISILRKHLGDAAIHTVPKFGYRFAYPVTLLSPHLPSTNQPVENLELSFDKTSPPPGPRPAIPTAKSYLHHKNWMAAALSLLAVALLGAHFTAAGPQRQFPAPRPTPTRLVVLPFCNLSPQPNTDYLANGLAKGLITTLGQLDTDRVRVLAACSSRLYAGTAVPAAQIARELNAQYLIDGIVQTHDQQLSLTVHLIDGHDQAMLWSGKFTRPVLQLQQVQTDIAAGGTITRLL